MNKDDIDFRRESLGEEVTCTIGDSVYIVGKLPQEQITCEMDNNHNVEIHLFFKKADIKKADIKKKKKSESAPPRKLITGDVFQQCLEHRPDFVAKKIKEG
jgi:hypothetical protein